jgi:ATP-dependent exoDNAse (exonuclease V) alpha subunit
LHLSGNVRQVHDWEREALGNLRAGRTAEALTTYLDAGRIHVAPTAADVHAEIAHAYLRSTYSPASAERVIVLTSTRKEADALNATIRDALQRRGRLTGHALSVPTSQGDQEFAVGDAVVITRNHRAFGVLNGTRGQVIGVDHFQGSMRFVDVDGQEHSVDRRLLSTGDVRHGYAMTVHKAQGATVDVALVSGTAALTKEAGYVALSRGTTANHIYVTTDDLAKTSPEAARREVAYDPSTAADALQRRLSRIGAHRLAAAQMPQQSTPQGDFLRVPPIHLPPTRGIER